MIPEEAIDAVARSMAKTCHDRRLPWHAYLVDARLAIEAAAPFIRAQALKDAADELDRLERISDWPEESCTQEENAEIEEYANATDLGEWLRTRAASERVGE